jgi:oligopeptide/dipeptide ABC transporter ATP-binding protein
MLEAVSVSRCYRARGLLSGSGQRVDAVDRVSFEVVRGESFAIVGESGAGKSTLARLLLALERPDSGVIRFDETPISQMPDSAVRPLRRRFQAVLQDPQASLNPRLQVATSIAEPLVAHAIGTRREHHERVLQLLDMVGLPAEVATRKPAALSVGECQRIAIARALAPGPELLVLDEPVSSLDVSVQSRILTLLVKLRHKLGLTMVLISHDLAVVHQVCDRAAIMLRGVVVEIGPTAVVLEHPAHPYTQQLLAHAPVLEPGWRPGPQPSADTGAPLTAAACRFADRCPQAEPRCSERPQLLEIEQHHQVACWRTGS